MERKKFLPQLNLKNQTSLQDRALDQTLVNLRPLRDLLLADDDRSRASLVLSELTLFLQRIARGVPVTEGDFRSLLRAAGLAEKKVEREAVCA